VAFLPGNRDFLVGDALLDACGVRRLSDPCVLQAFGRRVMVSHGDAWCLDDVEYLAFRSQVRSSIWQQEFLSRSLQERQAAARQMRQTSEARKAGLPDPSLWADVDLDEASRWMRPHGATELVHGHTHRPGSQTWSAGLQRHVLSDWDLEAQVPRAEVLRLTQEGWRRFSPP
jgi:UDP-2,3-diacylglucosamine hydrolase